MNENPNLFGSMKWLHLKLVKSRSKWLMNKGFGVIQKGLKFAVFHQFPKGTKRRGNEVIFLTQWRRLIGEKPIESESCFLFYRQNSVWKILYICKYMLSHIHSFSSLIIDPNPKSIYPILFQRLSSHPFLHCNLSEKKKKQKENSIKSWWWILQEKTTHLAQKQHFSL